LSLIHYHPIGYVHSPITTPLRPEEMRGVECRLVLDSRFVPAVAALEIGQHLVVVYHLHRVDEKPEGSPKTLRVSSELFTKRTANRPNPIGVTLTRVVAWEDATITVVGLDAIDGSPILDIKPYKPIFDAPPVTPETK
jgi:tRNA (Thr-GGU) A37 N-methylase